MPIVISPREKIALLAGAVFSGALLVASLRGQINLGWSEVLGFATGALGVFLTVKSSAWNFPVGLANNVFFGILFWQSRLFNDFGLQIVYFALGAWGWWHWTRGPISPGGHRRGDGLALRPIGRASALQIAFCVVTVPILTLILFRISSYFGGAAPFWDALTTALSLVAQFLLGRKWIQNWWFWIAADLVYVPLFLSRELRLTAALYAGFLLLCLMGLRNWKQLESAQKV